MSRPREPLEATSRPSMRDIGWAAGIFEGEGNVRMHGGSFVIVVTQKDTWILHRLKQLFGGSVDPPRNGSCSHWLVGGPRGRGFAYTIFSLLSPRRRLQVKAALAQVRMNIRYTTEFACRQCGKKHRRPQSWRSKFCDRTCYELWQHGRSKIRHVGVERAAAIRERLTDGVSCASIAREFEVDPGTVQRIKSGDTWTHGVER